MRPDRHDMHDTNGRPVSLQVFILCFNRPDFARQAIRSATLQTTDRFQIVISDNSTNDAVRAMVQADYPALEYRCRTNHLGVLDHLNQCLDEATADYVCLFHDDDLLSPLFVQRVLETTGQFPHAAAIGVNGWIVEAGRAARLSFDTLGKTHFVRDAGQLAAHYFSRAQLGIAPFPGYVYSMARIGDLRFDSAGGKYSDVSWLLRVVAKGGMAWIVEPLMTYRLHATNDSRQESIGDRLKLLAYFKRNASTVGHGLIEDFRFFICKKAFQLDRDNVRALSRPRQQTMHAYMTRYRCRRFLRFDHHLAQLRKLGVRLAHFFRRPMVQPSDGAQ